MYDKSDGGRLSTLGQDLPTAHDHGRPPSDLVEQIPVPDLEGCPDLGSIFYCISDQLALLAQRKVDLVFVVLALDVRHIDSDQYVCRRLLESQQREDEGREVRRR